MLVSPRVQELGTIKFARFPGQWCYLSWPREGLPVGGVSRSQDRYWKNCYLADDSILELKLLSSKTPTRNEHIVSAFEIALLLFISGDSFPPLARTAALLYLESLESIKPAK